MNIPGPSKARLPDLGGGGGVWPRGGPYPPGVHKMYDSTCMIPRVAQDVINGSL